MPMDTMPHVTARHGEMIKDESVASKMLIQALSSSVKKYLRPDCGILFSGGVDSSLVTALCVRHLPDIKLFTVGFEGSNDIGWAANAADIMELGDNIHMKIIGLEDVESNIPNILNALKTADPMAISLGIPLYLACAEAKAENIGLLLSGQGADELFGGYRRYLEIAENGREALHKAIVCDVSGLPDRDIKRDKKVAKLAGMELAAPIIDPDIIELGLSISADLKVKKIYGEIWGKYILRRTAEQIIPGEIAWKRKKALQYGSGVWAAMGKLARTAGFKKQDKGYIRKYLYSVAEENRIKLDVTL